LLSDKLVGNAVVMTIHLDMVVDVDPGLFPLRILIGVGGKAMRAGLSTESKRSFLVASSFWNFRVLRSVSFPAMQWLSSDRVKKV
jgi:hypothetical protein